MTIKRDRYLKRLVERRHNGFVKIITGIRRCGKSFLLFKLFRDYLIKDGVKPSQIVEVALDVRKFAALKNPIALGDYIASKVKGRGWHYVFIDEIQECGRALPSGLDVSRFPPEERDGLYVTFYDTLNELLRLPNVDVYVTGSNSKMLSSDIATNFRDRGDEMRLHPLSFAEFLSASGCEKGEAWERYLLWGGMPGTIGKRSDEARKDYLRQLFDKVYFKDIVERHKLKGHTMLGDLADLLSSAVGSLTNAKKIADTITTVQRQKTSQPLVSRYLGYFEESYLFSKARRFDVKGRRYLSSPAKYYSEDIGLRNVRLNMRQGEEPHLMENAIYNELVARGCSVDVGIVDYVVRENGRQVHRQSEIDFVVNVGTKKIYVQSAFAIPDEAKKKQETVAFMKSGDFFRKIVVVSGFKSPQQDENGIVYVGVIPFMLDGSILTG
ncbi:MAG: ATP-binding protein [Kiritimatiellae bacterium]|nr:ATP-binding protein [Kiritimatiellia bacterium]MBQ3341870.1 ATP-binding protein [Kiritimatiellia bacterium]